MLTIKIENWFYIFLYHNDVPCLASGSSIIESSLLSGIIDDTCIAIGKKCNEMFELLFIYRLIGNCERSKKKNVKFTTRTRRTHFLT